MNVGGFQIERPIARGGMGEVFEATQLSLGRKVALKVVASELSADAVFVERFRREARAAAAIEHPNILPVYETGETEDGRLYMAMRLVRGGDLASLLREQGRLEPGAAVHILAQVADALDAAHDDGLVHRDVKPANVLLEQGSGGRTVAYLADFGLAKTGTVGSAAYQTRSGHVVGTVDYMAPEQVRGERVGRGADVYAFGCMLFAALTGAPPYKRESDYDTMSAHINEPVPVPSQLLPTIPQALDKVVFRAMAKDPQARAHSAGALMRWAASQPGVGTGSVAGAEGSRVEPRSPSGAVVVAPSGMSHSGTVADQLPARQSVPDRRVAPTPLPESADDKKRKAWWVTGIAAAVLASAGLAVGVVLLLTGGEDDAQAAPFDQQLQRVLTPLIDENESVSEALEGIGAGASGSALRSVRSTLEAVDEAAGELEELDPPPAEQPRLQRAEELMGAEQEYLDAVGSVLNNPSSPRAGELLSLEGDAEDALSDLDAVASGLEGSLTGADSLIAYSRSRLDARELREQQAAIAERERQEEAARAAALAEEEREFARQVDALLSSSAPFTDDAASVLDTMRRAADGDDVGFPLNRLRTNLDGVISNRGDSASSVRAITAPTEETRVVRDLLAAYFDAAQAQGQRIRECLDDVEESDLSDISSSCVNGLESSGASAEKSAFTSDYNALRSRLGLEPVDGF